MAVWTRAGRLPFSSLLRPPRRGLPRGDWLELRFVASVSLAFALIAATIAVTYPFLVAVRPANTVVHVAAAVTMGTSYALAWAGHRHASGLLLLSTLFLGAWALLLMNFGTPVAPVLSVATVAPAILAFSLRRLVLGWLMAATTLVFLGLHQVLFPADLRAAITLGVALLAVTALAGLAPVLRAAERRRADRAESGVRVEVARMRTLLDNLDQAAYIVDPERRVLAANQPAIDLFKSVRTELRIGADLVDCVPPQERAIAGQALEEVFSGQEVALERRLTVGDAERIFAVRFKPITIQGRLQGAVGAARDITMERAHQRLREEQARQQASLATLEEMSAFKSRLINAAAHDLNTPLTPIKFQLALLRRQLAKDAQARQTVEVLERNTDRLAAIVADLLDTARLESGAVRFRREPTDLARLVRDEAALLAPEAASKGVQVRVEAPAACPVQADVTRLSQVIMNLLANAIKFSGGQGTVEVECRAVDGGARVEVRDHGIGMAPDETGTVFQPFTRIRHGEEHQIPGTGLGLFICKSIIEAHGGTIGIESKGRGRGAIAWFTLPAATAQPRARAKRPPRPSTRKADAGRGARPAAPRPGRTLRTP